MASQAGRMYTGFGSVHYSASKAGQIGLSRVLAGELGPFNITVNCVSPSRTASAMALSFGDADKIEAQYIARTPLGRTGYAAGRGGDGRVSRLRRGRLHHRDDRRCDRRILHALSQRYARIHAVRSHFDAE